MTARDETCRRVAGLVLAVAGIVLILLSLTLLAGRPLFPDEQNYLNLAAGLAASLDYIGPDQQPTALRPPGYPLLLAPFLVVGLGKPAMVAIQILLFVITGWMTSRLAARAGGETAGLLAALLCTANPGLVGAALSLFPQMVSAFLLVWALYLAARADFRLTAADIIPLAVLWSLSALVNPMLLPLGLLHIGWMGWRARGEPMRRASFLRLALAGVICLGPLCGWMIRNTIMLGAPVVATNTGRNLMLGNAPWSDIWQGVSNDRPEVRDAVRGMSELEANRYQTALVIGWAQQDLAGMATKYVAKVATFFRLYDDLTVGSRTSRMAQMAYSFFYFCLLVLALISLADRKFRNSLLFAAAIAIIFYFAFSYSVFFNRIRFRLPTDYPMAILAAMGAHIVWKSVQDRIRSGRGRDDAALS